MPPGQTQFARRSQRCDTRNSTDSHFYYHRLLIYSSQPWFVQAAPRQMQHWRSFQTTALIINPGSCVGGLLASADPRLCGA